MHILFDSQIIKIPLSESDEDTPQLNQLQTDIAATKQLCQSLLNRQATFEELVTRQLSRMQSCLEDLLVLTPTPFPLAHKPPPPPPRKCLPHAATTQPPQATTTPRSVVSEESEPELSFCLPVCSSMPDHPSEHSWLSPVDVSKVRKVSCSRDNFAANLGAKIFSCEERTACNVKGVLGKKKFNEEQIMYIRQLTFDEYPITSTENKKKCWASSVRAIDSKNRQLCRRKKSQGDKENNPL